MKGEDNPMDAGFGMRYKPQQQVFLAALGYKSLTDNYEYGLQASGGYEF